MKKKVNEITTLYKCRSEGSRNNGLLKSCDFQFEFKDGFPPNCPLCGQKLHVISKGRSVSELMRFGYNLHTKKEDK